MVGYWEEHHRGKVPFHQLLGSGHDVNMAVTAGVGLDPQAGVVGQVCPLENVSAPHSPYHSVAEASHCA